VSDVFVGHPVFCCFRHGPPAGYSENAMTTFLYRFRPTDKLLGAEYQELEKQEIYFASPDELNDPLEGFTNLFWKGDRILWSNLLKHYLMCLMRTVFDAHICGPDHTFACNQSYVFSTEASLPTPEMKSLYHRICDIFFQHEDAAQLPALLSDRKSPIRRNELTMCLQALHLHALNAVITGMEECSLLTSRPEDGPFRAASTKPIPCKAMLDAVSRLELEHPDQPDIAEAVSAVGNVSSMQQDLIHEYNGISLKLGRAWQTIISEFPKRHVSQLEQLLYRDWYVASFMEDPTDAAMWGHYGDGHKGVCLIFKTQASASGKPAIRLRQINAWSGNNQGVTPIYGDRMHEFQSVTYESNFVELNFFRSLGRITMPMLNYWCRDLTGNVSPIVSDIASESAGWREKYWEDYLKAVTTKLPDWAQEKEYRLPFYSFITDLTEKSTRKLQYHLEDLQGLIFGIKTSTADKIRIMHIVEEKCRKEGRTDFEFYQAVYSSFTGRIVNVKLGLIKFAKSAAI